MSGKKKRTNINMISSRCVSPMKQIYKAALSFLVLKFLILRIKRSKFSISLTIPPPPPPPSLLPSITRFTSFLPSSYSLLLHRIDRSVLLCRLLKRNILEHSRYYWADRNAQATSALIIPRKCPYALIRCSEFCLLYARRKMRRSPTLYTTTPQKEN